MSTGMILNFPLGLLLSCRYVKDSLDDLTMFVCSLQLGARGIAG